MPVVVQFKNGSADASSGFGVTFDSAVTTGNTVLVAIQSYYGGSAGQTPIAVTDNKGNTYTLRSGVDSGSVINGLYLYSADNVTGGSGFQVTITPAAGGFYGNATVIECTGTVSAGSFDQQHTAAAPGSPISSGNVTTTAANELLVGLYGTVQGTTDVLTPDAGWAKLAFNSGNGFSGLDVGTQTVSATGTYAFTGSLSSSHPDDRALIGTFKLTGGGGTTYTLTTAAGSFALTGESTLLKAGRLLAAAVATFALTGEATALSAGRHLPTAQAGYTLTGEPAGLVAGRHLTAAQASYTITGEPTAFKAARVLTAAQASFALTGEAVTLTYTPTGGPTHTLTAAQAVFTLTGEAAGLVAARKLAAAQASCTLTALAVSLSAGRHLATATGTLTLTGEAVGLVASRTLVVTRASYTLTGFPVVLTYSGAAVSVHKVYAPAVVIGRNAVTVTIGRSGKTSEI